VVIVKAEMLVEAKRQENNSPFIFYRIQYQNQPLKQQAQVV